MTTSAKTVLIAGGTHIVLDPAVQTLTDRGYHAVGTTEFDKITDQFDARDFDLVMFGTRITPERKIEIRDAFLAANPDLEFVQGFAGIPGLIVDQVEGAFAAKVPGQAPVYEAADRRIRLSLMAPLAVKVTVYWTTERVPPAPKSKSAVLVDDNLPAGEHEFPIPEAVALEAVAPDAVFATVQAGGAYWSFPLVPVAG